MVLEKYWFEGLVVQKVSMPLGVLDVRFSIVFVVGETMRNMKSYFAIACQYGTSLLEAKLELRSGLNFLVNA